MNKLILFALSPMFLAGCVPTTPNLDDHHGEAVRLMTAKQIINPKASSNNDSVKGMDGKAAVDAMRRYHDSFKDAAPATNGSAFGTPGGK